MNVTKSNIVWLVAGLVITLLFLVFSTPVYELLYFSPEFSNEMYNSNMYMVLAISTSLICWVVAATYYLLIDKVKFDRFFHWFIVLFIVILLCPAVTYVYPSGEFSELNLDYESHLLHFALINIGVSLVLFTIVSFSIKGLSKNLTTTPI